MISGSQLKNIAQLLIFPLHYIGTVTTVGLKKEEFDRSQINFEPCLTSKNDTFKSKYGCSSTQANCKMLKGLGGLQNCSVSTYFGLPKLGNSIEFHYI